MKKLLVVLLTASSLFAADRSAIVLWLPNPSGDNVTGYRVYQGTNATGTFNLVASVIGTNATVTGIPPVAAWFRVTAVNSAGESDPSDSVMLAAIPAKPTATVSGVFILTNIIIVPIP
jgi:hypothetical protein